MLIQSTSGATSQLPLCNNAETFCLNRGLPSRSQLALNLRLTSTTEQRGANREQDRHAVSHAGIGESFGMILDRLHLSRFVTETPRDQDQVTVRAKEASPERQNIDQAVEKSEEARTSAPLTDDRLIHSRTSPPS